MQIQEFFYWVGLICMILGFCSLSIIQIKKVSEHGIYFFVQKLDQLDKKLLKIAGLFFCVCVISFVIGAIVG